MLDQFVQRLQNMPGFDIHQVTDRGEATPWYKVDGTIIRDLVIRETDLAVQVQSVAAQIAHWGRMCALTKRVWEIREREYRKWRSEYYLAMLRGAEDTDAKKPTEKQIEAMYRSEPDYATLQNEIERAEEAYSSSADIRDAFRAKRDMLKATVYKSRDDGSVSLSI